MRNLTQEAIDLAEQAIIQANPPLATSQVREQLPAQTKQVLLMQLEMLFEAYMSQLIEEIRHKHDTQLSGNERYDTI
jgi:hypothetical protein